MRHPKNSTMNGHFPACITTASSTMSVLLLALSSRTGIFWDSLIRTPSPRPVGTDAGNNTTTLNGERDQPSADSTSGNPMVGNGRKPIHTRQLSWENRSSMDDSVFPSSPGQEVSNRASVRSKDRSHENGQEQAQVKKKPMIRRATIPSNFMSRIYNSSPMPSSQLISQGSSTFATSSQRYTGLRSMSINPGSMRVKMRPNPSANLSLRQKKVQKTSAGIVTPVQNPNLKILKIVLAGNDLLVSHMAKAYAYLQLEEPNLKWNGGPILLHPPLPGVSGPLAAS